MLSSRALGINVLGRSAILARQNSGVNALLLSSKNFETRATPAYSNFVNKSNSGNLSKTLYSTRFFEDEKKLSGLIEEARFLRNSIGEYNFPSGVRLRDNIPKVLVIGAPRFEEFLTQIGLKNAQESPINSMQRRCDFEVIFDPSKLNKNLLNSMILDCDVVSVVVSDDTAALKVLSEIYAPICSKKIILVNISCERRYVEIYLNVIRSLVQDSVLGVSKWILVSPENETIFPKYTIECLDVSQDPEGNRISKFVSSVSNIADNSNKGILIEDLVLVMRANENSVSLQKDLRKVESILDAMVASNEQTLKDLYSLQVYHFTKYIHEAFQVSYEYLKRINIFNIPWKFGNLGYELLDILCGSNMLNADKIIYESSGKIAQIPRELDSNFNIILRDLIDRYQLCILPSYSRNILLDLERTLAEHSASVSSKFISLKDRDICAKISDKCFEVENSAQKITLKTLSFQIILALLSGSFYFYISPYLLIMSSYWCLCATSGTIFFAYQWNKEKNRFLNSISEIHKYLNTHTIKASLNNSNLSKFKEIAQAHADLMELKNKAYSNKHSSPNTQ